MCFPHSVGFWKYFLLVSEGLQIFCIAFSALLWILWRTFLGLSQPFKIAPLYGNWMWQLGFSNEQISFLVSDIINSSYTQRSYLYVMYADRLKKEPTFRRRLSVKVDMFISNRSSKWQEHFLSSIYKDFWCSVLGTNVPKYSNHPNLIIFATKITLWNLSSNVGDKEYLQFAKCLRLCTLPHLIG